MADGTGRGAVVRSTLVHVVAETRNVAEADRGTAYQRNVT